MAFIERNAQTRRHLRWFLVWAIVMVLLMLFACATPEVPRPPQERTTVVEMKVPVPVPCFTEAERPVRRPPTPIDLTTATVDQMAAAIAADDLNDALFAAEVDALFLLCLKRDNTGR